MTPLWERRGGQMLAQSLKAPPGSPAAPRGPEISTPFHLSATNTSSLWPAELQTA